MAPRSQNPAEDSRVPPRRRSALTFWVPAITAFVVLTSFGGGIDLYTNWLWFQSVNFQQIFTTELTAKIALFCATALVFVVFFLTNAFVARWLVRRNILFFSDETLVTQRVVTYAVWAIALLLGWMVGSTASANWLTVLEYLRQVPFGIADPIFGKDVSFYIFTLPLLKFAQGWLVIVLFLSLFGAAGIYLLEQQNNLQEGRFVVLPHVLLHLSILGALIFGAFAWGHWLDAFDLMYSSRGVVFGASYTDIVVLLPGLRVMIGLALLSAALLLVNIFVRRNASLPLAAIIIWMVGGFLLRGLIPGVIQRFIVEPNELARESAYIRYNIDFTSHAYNLDKIESREFSTKDTLTTADLEDNLATLENIRLWDYGPLLETFQQLQELRLYYTFLDVDLDRYDVNGKYRQVALSAREMDITQLQSPTWINQKLQFTHGYGVVMNPVNEISAEGLPNLWIKNLPPQSSVSLPITRPEIYFGENTTDYVFVNTREKEFDYPGEGDESVYTTYAGTGGVKLDNYFKRIAFAIRMADANILLSKDITTDSAIMIYRQIKTRVQAIAPFLQYDNDPYIVVGDDGKLYWLLDAYTSSSLYPYSERVNGTNYIRNSVKVVIDPYHGSVAFYLYDPTDPLAQTFNRIFPGIFQPAEQIPATLKRHIRYPEGLFRVQSDLYRTYHMKDPKVFYNKEDLWAVPQETLAGASQPVEPYYIIARLPGESADEFMLIQPFTPHNKDNLVAWLAARSDGENYGGLVSYRFPKQKLLYGPRQIEARIDQDPEISAQFSLWDQGGSQVIRGNLLVLPLGDALLYVEPIYLQAESGRIPELKRVIVASGDQVIIEETLAKGLAGLLGGMATPTLAEIQPEPAAEETQPVAGDTVGQLAESASAHYEAAQKALQQGDWAVYGAELDLLKADLDELVKLTGEK